MHWLHIRGSPDGKSKERTLGEFWEFGEHRSIQKNAESTGRSATIFATILGRKCEFPRNLRTGPISPRG